MEPALNHSSTGEIRALLADRSIALKKRFGQNFLTDPTHRARIAETIASTYAVAAGGPPETVEEDGAPVDRRHPVWEIGPGLGALTDALLEREITPRVFELDRAFIALLGERYGGRVSVEAGDALRTLPAAVQRYGAPRLVCGNLPYSSASALVALVAESFVHAPPIVALVQRELAERLAARPGSGKAYSALSVLVSIRYDVRILADVPPAAFFPRPEVESSLVRLTVRSGERSTDSRSLDSTPATASPAEARAAAAIARTVFGQRRKALRNTLGPYRAAAESVGIDPARRPEEIPPESYLAAARAYLAATDR